MCDGATCTALGGKFLARPPYQLRSLPIEFRWEVTRRHPYYQINWQFAGDEHRQSVLPDPLSFLLRQSALAILGLIGVSSEPPNPAKEFAELDAEGMNAAWLSGAVQPISNRGLFAMLLTALPKETLREIGALLQFAEGEDASIERPKVKQALLALTTFDLPGLDRYPDEPYVSVNPAASERELDECLKRLMKSWKSERGLPDKRVRADQFHKNLEVWDLREGWNAGRYDQGAELSFQEIAARLGRNQRTVVRQYKQAFELVTGHPYSSDSWLAVFRILKFRELICIIGPQIAGRPKPTLPEAEESLAEAFDLFIHGFLTLIKQGRTNEQIIAAFRLDEECAPSIDYLRNCCIAEEIGDSQ